MKIAGYDVTFTKDAAQVGYHHVTLAEVDELRKGIEQAGEKWPRYFRENVGDLLVMRGNCDGERYCNGHHRRPTELDLEFLTNAGNITEITAEEADALILCPKDTPPPEQLPDGYEWTGEFRKPKIGELNIGRDSRGKHYWNQVCNDPGCVSCKQHRCYILRRVELQAME